MFGIPNAKEKRIDYAIQIPKAASLILKHSLDAPMAGLDTVPVDLQPPVAILFWSFRIMVGIGILMLAIGIWSLIRRWQGKLYQDRWLHRLVILAGPSGFVAVLAGWIITEVGRQPYTVYGLLKTANSLSPIEAPAVGTSLIAFIVVYFFVFGAGAFYILRLMGKTAYSKDTGLHAGPVRTAGITPAAQIPEADKRS